MMYNPGMEYERSLRKEIRKTIEFIDHRIAFKGRSSETLTLVKAHLSKMILETEGCNTNRDARLLMEKRIKAVRTLAYQLEATL